MTSIVKRLTSGSMLRGLNIFAQMLVSFALMPFVVHSLGDRMYGFWALIGTFIGYYGLLDFGLTTAVSRHLAAAIGSEDREECNDVYSSALIIYSGVGLLALLVTLLLAILSPLFIKNPEDMSLFWKVILILGINTAISFPIRAFGGILTAQMRFDILSLLQLLSLILRTILIVLVLSAGYKVLALAIATFLSGVPEKILSIYYSKKNLPLIRFSAIEWKRDTARTLFSYSSFTFIAKMGDQLRFYLDSLVITAYVGLVAVTHYRIASYLSVQFIILIASTTGVLQPLFSRLHGEENHEQIKKTFFLSSKISFCVTSFVGFGLIAWGKPFIERWMGSSYLDAYPCLVILVIGCTFDLWQSPSVSLLYGISKHHFYALFNCIEGVANLVLSLLLVKQYGILGVALGTAIPMALIRLIAQPIYVCRVASIEYREYVWKMGRSLLNVILSLALPFYVTVRFIEPKYTVLMILGLVSIGLYSVSIWLFEFTPGEAQILRRGVLPRKVRDGSN
jgi:O-antigen/teichoic acid export membrane protein